MPPKLPPKRDEETPEAAADELPAPELTLPPAIPHGAVRLGAADVPADLPSSVDESGMLMGRGHPALGGRRGGRLARYDPLVGGPGGAFPGEPDRDDFPPPGSAQEDDESPGDVPPPPFGRRPGPSFPGPGVPPFF